MSTITPTPPSESDNFLLPEGSRSVKYLGTAILGIAGIGATCVFITIVLSFVFAIFFQVTWVEGFWPGAFLIAAIGMALSTIIITMIASVNQAQRKIERGFGPWIRQVAELSIMQHLLLFALFGAIL